MHDSSYRAMQRLIEEYLDPKAPLKILDVGSYNVNGSYRALFDYPRWSYTGTDVQGDKTNNVDVVMDSPYALPFGANSFDLVISGQALEHIEYPWLTIKEIARVLRPAGLAFLIAPSKGHEHRYPVDCWRFLPDGFRALARWSELDVVEVRWNKASAWGDLVGVFRSR